VWLQAVSRGHPGAPIDKPEKWDAADAVDEGFDCGEFIGRANAGWSRRRLHCCLPSRSVRCWMTCRPAARLISPRVLTPGGLLVFGGAPKVGKSDFCCRG
jgi:hypothetical protein